MDAKIIETCDCLEKLLKEGKMEEAKLVSQTLKLFPEKEVDRVVNPVHPDIKNACLTRLRGAISLHIRSIYNLSKIGKLSKDEIRPFVVQWITVEIRYDLSKEELEMVLELI
jgi:hypothetical protein